MLFRLANTLDAMWGYRNARFNLFGRVAARIDDVLNYVPARLTALSYVLLAGAAALRAWRCWRAQAPALEQPERRPGDGQRRRRARRAAGRRGRVRRRGRSSGRCWAAARPPRADDIRRAWRLVLRARPCCGCAASPPAPLLTDRSPPCLNTAATCARRSGATAATDWIDLSTGINPLGYPAPRWRRMRGSACRNRIPRWCDAACAYYGARTCCRWPAPRPRSRPCRACARPRA